MKIDHPDLRQRQILYTEHIPAAGTFEAFYTAEAMLKEMGYITGSMERQAPIGFAPRVDVDYISKWSNMSSDDRLRLHGVMLPEPDFREGGVVLVFFEAPLVCPLKEIPFKKAW
jgi:hypothetical protein